MMAEEQVDMALEDVLAELKREIRMRQSFYTRQVMEDKLKLEVAKERIGRMATAAQAIRALIAARDDHLPKQKDLGL